MPDTDSTTRTERFAIDEQVLVEHHARYTYGQASLTWRDDGQPLAATIVANRDNDGDYRVMDEDGHTSYVNEQYLSRPDQPLDNVTLTADTAIVTGGRYLLTVGADMSDGSGVFFNHTEPLLVTVPDLSDTLNEGLDINVERLDSDRAEPQTQYVALRYLLPEPNRPETRDTVNLGDVYRITSTEGGHGFPVGTLVKVATAYTDGRLVDTNNGYVSAYVTTGDNLNQPPWLFGTTAFVNIRSTTPSNPACVEFVEAAAQPEPEPVVEAEPEPTPDLPPPEEVLRRLTERDNIDPEVRRRRSIASITDLLQQVTEARTAVDAARHDRASWLDRLIERSREVADEQEWCEVYDRGMEELGLPSRHDREPEQEEVRVTATAEVEVSFDSDDFESWFSDGVSSEFASIDSHSTSFTVNVSLERTVMADEGSCVCGETDDDEWDMPSWVRDGGYSINIIDEECSND